MPELLYPENFYGLTGGIGSGKSTVSEAFAAKGAVIIDADATIKELQEPGEPGFEGMVELFGRTILDESGALNRKAVGRLIFADPLKKKALENLLHPLVWESMDTKAAQARSEHTVIYDVPLLVESGRAHLFRNIVIVDTPVELAVSRVVEYRGYEEEEVRARIAQQVSREERRQIADFTICNDGTKEHLQTQIDSAWEWMQKAQSLGTTALKS